MERMLFAIDVGTTKVCTLVAEALSSEELRVVGMGVVPARGMQKGAVVNVEEASQAIQASLAEAERMSGVKIEQAVVSLSGVQIASVNSRGSTIVSRSARGISKDDVDRAMEAALGIALSASHELVHSVPRSFTVDGQDGIRNPIGMFGHRLEVEAHLVTTPASAMANLTKCVRAAGVQVEGVIFQALAAGEAILTPEERESGVVVVDIGGGTTDVAIFLEGSVWHSAVIGIGGQLITRDLVICLQMPAPAAEELKLRCGYADPSDVMDGEVVEIEGFGDQPRRSIPRKLLAEIIGDRVEQIFIRVGEEITRSGYAGLLPAGVVLCGGTAQLGGIRAVARRVLNMPVRVGTPRGVRGLMDVATNPAYACGVGLLQWANRYGVHVDGRRRPADDGTWRGWLRDWVNRLLPS